MKDAEATTMTLPPIGLGTWRMGESHARRASEIAALRHAIEIGYRLFDTAEMYGEGGAEEVVGQALADAIRAGDVARSEITVVSKVYPHNASRRGTVQACERSLKRLQLDTIDLYLLHWRGPHPLAETATAMQGLAANGRIGHWGVSNFDVDDMEELAGVADDCRCNQVWYSLGERGPGFALLPWLRGHGVAMMAYSPIDQGSLAADSGLAALAAPLGLTPAQLALAWVCAQPGVTAIPKAVTQSHLRDNFAAAQVKLSAQTLSRLDQVFPPPTRKRALAIN